MIDKNARENILAAVAKEKESAIKNHGYFHSDHEFWAVLCEEAEELKEDSTCITSIVRRLWDSVRGDSMFNNIDTLNTIRENAINAVCEAIQVVVVIDKYLEGESKKVKCEKCGGGMQTVFSQKDGKHTMTAICPYCGHCAVLNERSEDEIMQMEE